MEPLSVSSCIPVVLVALVLVCFGFYFRLSRWTYEIELDCPNYPEKAQTMTIKLRLKTEWQARTARKAQDRLLAERRGFTSTMTLITRQQPDRERIEIGEISGRWQNLSGMSVVFSFDTNKGLLPEDNTRLNYHLERFLTRVLESSYPDILKRKYPLDSNNNGQWFRYAE